MPKMRIQKVLSECGILSRRKTEEYIAQGRVTVNGRKAAPGAAVDPQRDIVMVDGKRVALDREIRAVYLMLNKPRGYVTTMHDDLGRRCVAELVADVPERVYPIGRLDRESEGLLLLTNDGAFANLIMHPRYHVPKVYRVTVRPEISEEQIARLCAGVELDGSMTQPAEVQVLTQEPGRVVLQITIREGRNRQIRRMCEAVGLEVARLRRSAVGPVRLGMLKPGKWRELTRQEISGLRASLSSPDGTDGKRRREKP